MRKEIKSHAMMSHPNIIKFYHLIENDDKLYMLLEYAPNGDLYKYLVDNEKFSERDSCKIIAQVALALQYIHRKGILHRDLKPENILLDSNFIVKVSDFGWCGEFNKLKRHVPGSSPNRVTFCGTYEYMAPEVIRGDYQDEKVDVWSLGILLYELLHGKTPFRSSAPLDIQRNIIEGRFSIDKRLSTSAIDLLRRILRANPTDRYSVNQLLAHPFIKVKPTLIQKHIPNIEEFQSPEEIDIEIQMRLESTRTSSTEKKAVFSRKWTQTSKSQLVSASTARLLKAQTGLITSGSTSNCEAQPVLSPPKLSKTQLMKQAGSHKKLTLLSTSRDMNVSSRRMTSNNENGLSLPFSMGNDTSNRIMKSGSPIDDLQSILLYMKSATSPKKRDLRPANGQLLMTEKCQDGEGSRLRSLVNSISQSLKSSKIITEKKTAAKVGSTAKVLTKKSSGVMKVAGKIQTSMKASPSIIPEGLASRIEKLLTTPRHNSGPQNAQSASILPNMGTHAIPNSQNTPLTARRVHRKAQYSESNQSLQIDPSPKTDILRKLSSSSLKRPTLNKQNGSASLSRLRQNESNRNLGDRKKSEINLSPGRINIYSSTQDARTNSSSIARQAKEGIKIAYYNRISAEGNNSLCLNRSLKSRDKSSNQLSNSATSSGSALNLYRNLADKKTSRPAAK